MDTYNFSLPAGLPKVLIQGTAEPAGSVSERLTMNANRHPFSCGQPNHKCIPFTHYIVAKTIKYCDCSTIKTHVIKAGGGEKKRTLVLKAQH